MATYEGANLAWQLGGDPALVRELAKDADALVLVECRTKDNHPIDVCAILGPDWWVAQNLRNAALSGTAIAIRKGGTVKRRRIAHVFRRLVRISGPGRDVQARYLRAVPIRDTDGNGTLMGAHIPIKSTGLQDEATAVVGDTWRTTKGRKLLFADCNSRPAGFAAEIGAPHSSGDGVVVWAWSRGWSNVRVSWRARKGTDHATGRFCTDRP